MKITLGGYELTLCLFEEGKRDLEAFEPQRHCNAEHELFVVLGGECSFDVEEHYCALSRGDALLVYPSQFHCPVSTSSDLSLLVLPFTVRKAGRSNKPYEIVRLSDFSLAAAERLLAESKQRSPLYEEAAYAAAALLLTELFRLTGGDGAQKRNSAAAARDKRFEIIDNFFEMKGEPDGSEEELAARLHLSRRQLNRILKQSYGLCFRELLLKARMDRAAFLLRTTQLSISDVAQSVGYNSMTSFFKAFKHRHSTTPRLYREGLSKTKLS